MNHPQINGQKLDLDQNMVQLMDQLGCTPHSTDPAWYAVAWNRWSQIEVSDIRGEAAALCVQIRARALEWNQICPVVLCKNSKPQIDQIVNAISTLSVRLISTPADVCSLEFSEVKTQSCPKPRTVGFPPRLTLAVELKFCISIWIQNCWGHQPARSS